jgi:endonuclease/exonuclease/phosphatase family metal-dependent hydrolase
MTLTFGTWNLGTAFGRPVPPERLERQLGFLRALAPDVLALQEVVPSNYVALCEDLRGADRSYRYAVRSTVDGDGPPGIGCAILSRYELSDPRAIEGFLPSDRAIVADVRHGEAFWTFASVWIPWGQRDPVRNPQGPERKLGNFSALADWAATQRERTVLGIDANSPKVDHPDLDRNVYFSDRIVLDQGEALLHDPRRRVHRLRDAYRLFLELSPTERSQALDHFDAVARAQRGEGCLATSHVVQKQRRRFDFIYVSPDLASTSVEYREEALGYRWRDAPASALSLSDHALVLAALEPATDDSTPNS